MSDAFQRGWYNRVVEVIDKYHPDQLWFEIGFSDPECIGEEYVKSALAQYFNTAAERGKEVVVTRKADDLPLSCSVLDIEAGELDEAHEDVWQTDTTIGVNWAWAYSPDAVAQPANALIDAIVDRKSKNGVTLLSAAPRADGTLPPSQIEVLRQIGEWMAVNKPALYGSTPAPFVDGAVDCWRAGTIRFTTKGNDLYAIELGNDFQETDPSPDYPVSAPPRAPYVIPGVQPVAGSEIVMLGADRSLPWRQDGEDVVIEGLPDPLPCDHAWTFQLRYK